MLQARELILQKRFDEARAILRQVDHPAAAAWLEKLDKIAPEARPAAPEEESQQVPPAKQAHSTPRKQLETARELILQKKFDEARAILAALDHPTARKWLQKLDDIAPPAPVEAGDADIPRAEQEAQLITAQELVLSSKFDAAKAILDRLTIPEAVLWQNKTQMNKFREFQSVWLDMYDYGLDPARQPPDLGAWRCAVCGRDIEAAALCPQRGHSPCPMQIQERAIAEPNRLALILGGIYMGETRNIKPLLKGMTVKQLAHWRGALEEQLRGLWERDIRRPTLETAVILLRQLEETRKLTASGMTAPPSHAEQPPEPAPDSGRAGSRAGDPDSKLRGALRQLGRLLKSDSPRDDDDA